MLLMKFQDYLLAKTSYMIGERGRKLYNFYDTKNLYVNSEI